MSKDNKPVAPAARAVPAEKRSSSADISAFLSAAKSITPVEGSGRLILALDATMSRQPTWDLACTLQARMFEAVAKAGGLAVQLVYFRGFGECRASKFVGNAASLTDLMVKIDCRGGRTQIGKVFSHALKENARQRVSAVIFIGDAMEENVDELAARAGELGLHGVPLFLFQEGSDRAVERAYREFARLSRGAWFRFDRKAPDVLAQLLSSIAVYASGGLKALEKRGAASDRKLLSQLRS